MRDHGFFAQEMAIFLEHGLSFLKHENTWLVGLERASLARQFGERGAWACVRGTDQ